MPVRAPTEDENVGHTKVALTPAFADRYDVARKENPWPKATTSLFAFT